MASRNSFSRHSRTGIAAAAISVLTISASFAAEPAVRRPPDSSGPQMSVPVAPPSQEPGAVGGVAKPPAGIDPGIHARAPAPDASAMPVIPPPGAPGGNPAIVPK